MKATQWRIIWETKNGGYRAGRKHYDSSGLAGEAANRRGNWKRIEKVPS